MKCQRDLNITILRSDLYRLLSNFPFLPKMIENVVAVKLLDHNKNHNLCENLQSLYRCYHSTETALVIMSNLLEVDNQRVILMEFTDLSPVIDTANLFYLQHYIKYNKTSIFQAPVIRIFNYLTFSPECHFLFDK